VSGAAPTQYLPAGGQSPLHSVQPCHVARHGCGSAPLGTFSGASTFRDSKGLRRAIDDLVEKALKRGLARESSP
jgi:hypothetical protein